jgi:hypothetical protein
LPALTAYYFASSIDVVVVDEENTFFKNKRGMTKISFIFSHNCMRKKITLPSSGQGTLRASTTTLRFDQ